MNCYDLRLLLDHIHSSIRLTGFVPNLLSTGPTLPLRYLNTVDKIVPVLN
jgi:hypothetical protein